MSASASSVSATSNPVDPVDSGSVSDSGSIASDSGSTPAPSDKITMSDIRVIKANLEKALDEGLLTRSSNSYENVKTGEDAEGVPFSYSVFNVSKAKSDAILAVATAGLQALSCGQNWFHHFMDLFDRIVTEVQFRGAPLIIQHLAIITLAIQTDPDHESNSDLFASFSGDVRIPNDMLSKTDWATPFEVSKNKKVKIGQTAADINNKASFKTLAMIHMGICESKGGLKKMDGFTDSFNLLAQDVEYQWGRKYASKSKEEKARPVPDRTYADNLGPEFDSRQQSPAAPPSSSAPSQPWGQTAYPPLGYAVMPMQQPYQQQYQQQYPQQVAMVASVKEETKPALDPLDAILKHTLQRGISETAIMQALLSLQPDQ